MKTENFTYKDRNRILSELSLLIQEVYGSRCSMNEGGCLNCAVWTMFDAMDRLIDSSAFDK